MAVWWRLLTSNHLPLNAVGSNPGRKSFDSRYQPVKPESRHMTLTVLVWCKTHNKQTQSRACNSTKHLQNYASFLLCIYHYYYSALSKIWVCCSLTNLVILIICLIYAICTHIILQLVNKHVYASKIC
jgi:hypothetical protein